MNKSLFTQLLVEARMSLGALIAVWTSLALPAVLMIAGLTLLGGGAREAAGVLLAAALFAAGDLFFVMVRLSRDEALIGELQGQSVLDIARYLSARFY